MPTPHLIAKTLSAAKQTLAVAESCTGGLISSKLTDIPGSSAFFKGGIVAYSNEIKTGFVKVPAALILKHGAVSAPVASALATNIRKVMSTDYGIGVTGIAGPTGGTKAKPVGLVFIAVASAKKTVTKRFVFEGNRRKVRIQSTEQALKILSQLIKKSTVSGQPSTE